MEKDYVFVLAVSFVLTVIFGYFAIPLAKKYKARQSIRECGPKSHRIKSGTPTMGGLFMMLGLTAAVLIHAYPEGPSAEMSMLLFITLGHSFLGFLDDFIKAEKKRNLGLTAKQKIVGQLILGGVFAWIAVENLGIPTAISVPFTDWEWPLGWLFYPFCVIVIVGASNAVNLTDGLDGLAAGCCVIAFSAYAVYGYAHGVYDLPDIGVFCMALVGVCAAFLFFNYHPAKIFMGDTGSLALGGALAGIAVLTRTELLLIFLGFIFVAEALSVILQVASFKMTGKRIFKMSPIHHHFELCGWSEVRVVWTFWAVELLAAALTVFAVM